MRFPPLRRSYSNGQDGERGPSYYGEIWGYLQAWGFRILNDLQRDDLTTTAADLADLFAARVRERGRTWHPYDGRAPGLDLDTVDRLAENAANAVLRDWSSDWIASRREAGRTGGSRSRRGPTWTAEDLDALTTLMAAQPHLTVPELAVRLDRSPRTIKRMRAAVKLRS